MMKKTLLFGILFLSLNSYGQRFVKMVDEFTDEEYVVVEEREITYDGDSKTNGVIWGMFTEKKGGQWKISSLSLGVYGLSCVENTEVIFILENGEKVSGVQWNDFNCDGKVWITLKNPDIELMRTQRLSKIKVTNGRNYESYTFTKLSESMQNYYINLFKSLDDGNVNGFDLIEE